MKNRIEILPGQYFDAETGLHYNWHRTYSPTIGRYLRPDPIGLIGGINLFSYADGSPVNKIDKYGLSSVPVSLPIVVVPTPGGPVIIPMPPPPPVLIPTIGTPGPPPFKAPKPGGFDLDLCKAICNGKFKCRPIKRKICHTLCYITAFVAGISGDD